MDIKKNVDLKPYNTYHTGGRSDFLCICRDLDELEEALVFARENNLEKMIIGGGSNVLFSDVGFKGFVIVNKIDHIKFGDDKIQAGSGYPLSKLLSESAKMGLSGMEFLAGIPGTVGGAVVGNAGSAEKSIAGVLSSVAVYSPDGDIFELRPDEIEFSYRKSNLPERNLIVLEASFLLKKGDPKKSSKVIRENIKIKSQKQPVGFSCGSYFKNPKGITAGEVIEKLGFKGKKVGGAQVSFEHANFIINTGNAKSKDIYKLAQQIKKAAKEKLEINLEEEVRYIGDF